MKSEPPRRLPVCCGPERLEAGLSRSTGHFPKLAGWEWAQTAEDGAGLGERGGEFLRPSIRQMDQAFRRDSRRYDGGFFLY